MTWQKLSSKKVYQNRYMSVTEDELITDHGDHLTLGIVHKEPAVWIIAYANNQILLVRQYRYPVNYLSWEIPAGHAEQHDPELAASLELKEETGYSATHLNKIGEFFLAPGHLDQVGYVYLATELVSGEQQLESAEKGMQTKWVSLKELSDMIAGGTIKDGPTITAFKFFELYLSKQLDHE